MGKKWTRRGRLAALEPTEIAWRNLRLRAAGNMVAVPWRLRVRWRAGGGAARASETGSADGGGRIRGVVGGRGLFDAVVERVGWVGGPTVNRYLTMLGLGALEN
jgi:hypothetical protein